MPNTAEPGPGTQPVELPPFEPTVPQMIRAAVAAHGPRELGVLDDRRMTFADAEAASAAIAKGLLAIGVGKGTRVGLLAPNSPDWIAAWLAIGRIGAIGVLANTYYKSRELDWVLRHADVQVLLTVSRFLGHDYLARLEEVVSPGQDTVIASASHPLLRSVWVWGRCDAPWAAPMDELLAAGSAVSDEVLAAAEAEVVPADEFTVVYTSGSTSSPKGAVHTQGAVVCHAHNLWQFRDLEAGDRIYSAMPMFWVGGMVMSLVGSIYAGACLVFDERFEPGATLALIEREKVTSVFGWPHMAQLLVNHPDFNQRDLSSVRGGSLYALLPPKSRSTTPNCGSTPWA